MVLIVWLVVLVGLGVALAILTDGVPRMLALVALGLLIVNVVFSWLVVPLLFDAVRKAALVGLVSGVVGLGINVIVFALFIAAAAIASRPKPVAYRTAEGLR